ncbi:MAG: glycosyltransferase [Alphaproteobacteria bacterium]
MVSPRVGVVFASLNRSEMLGAALGHVLRQTYMPHRVIASVVSSNDLPSDEGLMKHVETIFGPPGSTVQRNTGLDRVIADVEFVIFLDDDFVPSRFFIERAVEFFEAFPDVVAANGQLLADGINSGGNRALQCRGDRRRLRPNRGKGAVDRAELDGLYGCNMVFRAGAIGADRFDERLKMYAWQEDIDFASRVGARGRVVKTRAFAGVHLGIRGGRTSGKKLGYAQVINPAYLVRKGTMRFSYALPLALRNICANHVKALRPEPWVDRVGRVRGNWIGIGDLLRGRVEPERIVLI